MDGEEDLLVVMAGVGCSINEKEAELPGVGTEREVAAGAGVGVIPARSGGAWSEGIAQAASRGNHGRAFFHGAVVKGVDGKAMPVDDVLLRRVVEDVNGYGLAVFEAQQGTWDLAVVGDGLDVDAGRDLERSWLNREGIVGGGRILCRGRSFFCGSD